MADIDKRLRYFNGQFLEQKDFRDEQDYHIDRQRRHNRTLHTRGVAAGLEVTGTVGDSVVKVAPGTALDDEGQQIVLTGEKTISLNDVKGTTALVVISYLEVPVDPATVGNQGEETRLQEQPDVIVVAESGAPPAGSHIRLARVTVGSGGTLSTAIDSSVRELAGVRLNPGVVTATVLADNAVTNNKIADGSVSGNKLSNNAVTTARIADSSVTTTKIIDQAVATNKIADLGVTTAKLADLGVTTGKIADNAVTTAKIANSAVTTVKLADLSVTNAQLANNAVTGPKILDGTINEVKLDPTTRAKLGGGMTNGGTINGILNVIGGLNVAGLIGGFGLDQMLATTLSFTSANGDGTLTSVTTGFIPRVILLTGGMSGRFDPNGVDNRFGGTIFGFAFQTTTITAGDGGPDTSFREAAISTPPINPDPSPRVIVTINQFCHGPNITRSAAGLVRQDVGNFAAIAGASFLNRGVSPVQGTMIQLSVIEMIPGRVTFRLSRALPSGASSVLDVESFSFNALILGHLETNSF